MRLILAALLGVTAAACLKTTDPLPLDITIEPPTSITTIDSVSFVVRAQGEAILGIETSFGDSETAFFPAGGARTATVTFRHRYTQSGTYDVTASVSDAVLGQKAATVQVNVQ